MKLPLGLLIWRYFFNSFVVQGEAFQNTSWINHFETQNIKIGGLNNELYEFKTVGRNDYPDDDDANSRSESPASDVTDRRPLPLITSKYSRGRAEEIYPIPPFNVTSLKWSSLITFDDFRDPPLPMPSFSKQIWVVPLWILPKLSAIPPLSFSVTTDPPFCFPKNHLLRSQAINNERSLICILSFDIDFKFRTNPGLS